MIPNTVRLYSETSLISVKEHESPNKPMGKLKKATNPANTMTNRMTLYKCRSCNRTDRKPFDADGPATCNHCSSPMDPLEIRYRCVRCGHIEWIEIGTTGKSCHKCGYRIFVKPRKEGPDGIKTLRAE